MMEMGWLINGKCSVEVAPYWNVNDGREIFNDLIVK